MRLLRKVMEPFLAEGLNIALALGTLWFFNLACRRLSLEPVSFGQMAICFFVFWVLAEAIEFSARGE